MTVDLPRRDCSTCRNRAPLCDACLHARQWSTYGPAWQRGHRWGCGLRLTVNGKAWPVFEESERLQEICYRRVADLAGAQPLELEPGGSVERLLRAITDAGGDRRLLEILARRFNDGGREAFALTVAQVQARLRRAARKSRDGVT